MTIYVGTNVKVVDRTGAKKVLIICLFKNRKKIIFYIILFFLQCINVY